MQRVLSKIEDPNLEILVVWIPAIRSDSYEASLQSRSLIPDSRARHYWDASQALGNAVAPVIGTKMRMAWDVYLVYGKDASWQGAPPEPIDWMHQKGTEDPERVLEDDKLEAALRAALK